MKIILSFFLISFSSISFGQGAGHPGSGPTEDGSEGVRQCTYASEQSKSLEEKFTTSWDKKYEGTEDFTALINHIIIENLAHKLEIIHSIKFKGSYSCDGDKKHISEIHLSKRPNRVKELNLLKKIMKNWMKIRQMYPRPAVCTQEYAKRLEHIDELQILIELYERNLL